MRLKMYFESNCIIQYIPFQTGSSSHPPRPPSFLSDPFSSFPRLIVIAAPLDSSENKLAQMDFSAGPSTANVYKLTTVETARIHCLGIFDPRLG